MTLSSQRFGVLRDEALKHNVTLITSQVVVDESVNKFRESLAKHARNAKKSVKSLSSVTTQEFLFSFSDGELERVVRIYRDNLVSLFRETGGEIYPYPKVSHEAVVQRAMHRRKPYGDGIKDSYRDTLIWHSLMEAIEDEDDVICLVTQNTDDFATLKGNSILLHEHLQEDLEQAGFDNRAVILIDSLGDIVESHVQRELAMLADIESEIIERKWREVDFESHVSGAIYSHLAHWDLEADANHEWLPEGVLDVDIVDDAEVKDYLSASVSKLGSNLYQVIAQVSCECLLYIEAEAKSDAANQLEEPILVRQEVVAGNLSLPLTAKVSTIYDQDWYDVSVAVQSSVIDEWDLLYES